MFLQYFTDVAADFKNPTSQAVTTAYQICNNVTIADSERKKSEFDADISETLKKVWFSTTFVQSRFFAVSRPFKYMNSPIFTFKIYIMETNKLPKAPTLQSSTIVGHGDNIWFETLSLCKNSLSLDIETL